MKSTCKGLLAAVLLGLHLLVVSMAASPALHHLLHHDSDAPGHQCAATLLIDGQIDRPDVACVAEPRPVQHVEICTEAPSREPAQGFLAALPAERAPPLA